MLRFTFLVFFIITLANFKAQAPFEKTYDPVTSSGQVPAVFIERSDETIARDLKAVQQSGKLSRAEGKEFLIVNNYALKRSLQSGKIIYNDVLTKYINSVANRIVEANPDYQGGLQLFIAKTSVPNAAAWRNGVILFNIGLLANLETEAQLAFILAHEMSHIQKRHSLQGYSLTVKEPLVFGKKKKRKELKGKAFGRGTLNLDKIFKRYRHSRQYEMEADLLGLSYLQKSPYSTADAISALELLKGIDKDQYSAIPSLLLFNPDSLLKIKKSIGLKLGDPSFDLSESKKKTFSFDKIKEAKERSEEEEEEEEKEKEEESIDDNEEISEEALLDSVATHPSLDDRLAQLKPKVSDNSVGDSFIGSPLDFIKFKTMARFELIEIHFNRLNYLRALYESAQLLQEYPNNEYLKSMLCKSAYWYTYMENQKSRDLFTPDPASYEGQAYGEFCDYFNLRGLDSRGKWCLSLIDHYAKANPDLLNIRFVEAQAEEQFGSKEKAKKLYKALLPKMKDTYGVFIQNKIDEL